jgi:hypothetical protein
MIQNILSYSKPYRRFTALVFFAYLHLQVGLHAFKQKSPSTIIERLRARDWIRTSTSFRMPPPEDGASTNFATRALLSLKVHKFTGSRVGL